MTLTEENQALRAEIAALQDRLNKALGGDLWRRLADRLRIRRMEARLLALLVERAPRSMAAGDIIDVLWGDDPNGGPAAQSIRVRVCYLRRRLEEGDVGGTVSRARSGAGYSITTDLAERLRNLCAEERIAA